jgi:hypothetical protein
MGVGAGAKARRRRKAWNPRMAESGPSSTKWRILLANWGRLVLPCRQAQQLWFLPGGERPLLSDVGFSAARMPRAGRRDPANPTMQNNRIVDTTDICTRTLTKSEAWYLKPTFS